jgi:hypothetical protein
MRCSAAVRGGCASLSTTDGPCGLRRADGTVDPVDGGRKIAYLSPALASSVSWWSSCRKAWTERYRCDASFATLLFSRTTYGYVQREFKLALDTLLTQRQKDYDQHGHHANTFELPVRVLWYPWSLLLTTYMVSDANLTPDERLSAEQLQQNLWRRLPEAVNEVTIGGTFRVAETPLVLGSVGKQYDWY